MLKDILALWHIVRINIQYSLKFEVVSLVCLLPTTIASSHYRNNVLTIHLKDLAFFSLHGLYREEKILGNNFIVNVHVHYLPQATFISKLEQTVNYEKLFELVQKRMEQPSALMETIAMDICQSILKLFPEVHATFFSIEKKHPPIEAMHGSVVVSYQLAREEMND
jgi:dihydroneopterin aldolase